MATLLGCLGKRYFGARHTDTARCMVTVCHSLLLHTAHLALKTGHVRRMMSLAQHAIHFWTGSKQQFKPVSSLHMQAVWVQPVHRSTTVKLRIA